MSQRPVGARLSWGAKWGIRFGLTLVVYAIVLFVINGSMSTNARGPSLGAVATIYLLGGLVAGLITGVLLPLTRWTIGAAIVGFVAALPVGILVRLATEGFANWATDDIATAILFAMLVGGPVGVIYRKIFLVGSATED